METELETMLFTGEFRKAPVPQTYLHIQINILMITMTPEEAAKRKEEWLERMKREGKLTRNPTEDHKFGLKVLQNTVRREILISLRSEKKSFEEIKEKFNLNDNMANFHLNMLEDALYIEKIEEEGKVFYVPTPRGDGYVENVELKK